MNKQLSACSSIESDAFLAIDKVLAVCSGFNIGKKGFVDYRSKLFLAVLNLYNVTMTWLFLYVVVS